MHFELSQFRALKKMLFVNRIGEMKTIVITIGWIMAPINIRNDEEKNA